MLWLRLNLLFLSFLDLLLSLFTLSNICSSSSLLKFSNNTS
nr:MAG TPA: hypothetical protein [Caudoviricetes sp.]